MSTPTQAEIQAALEYLKENCVETKAQWENDPVLSRVRHDTRFAIQAVRHLPFLLDYMTPKQQDDPEIVIPAVKTDGDSLQYASRRLRDTESIVRIAVKNGCNAIYSVSNRLRDDPDIVEMAVMKNSKRLNGASSRLCKDETFIRRCLAKSPQLSVDILNTSMVWNPPREELLTQQIATLRTLLAEEDTGEARHAAVLLYRMWADLDPQPDDPGDVLKKLVAHYRTRPEYRLLKRRESIARLRATAPRRL